MQNGSGEIPSDLTAFDALPTPIKRVMHCAPRPYAALSVREAWKRRGMTAEKYAVHMQWKIMRDFPGWLPDKAYTQDAY